MSVEAMTPYDLNFSVQFKAKSYNLNRNLYTEKEVLYSKTGNCTQKIEKSYKESVHWNGILYMKIGFCTQKHENEHNFD